MATPSCTRPAVNGAFHLARRCRILTAQPSRMPFRDPFEPDRGLAAERSETRFNEGAGYPRGANTPERRSRLIPESGTGLESAVSRTFP
jgi:hypothetical protein